MVTYDPPLRDYAFALGELFDFEAGVTTLPGYEDASLDLVIQVLEEAGRFCVSELLPLNLSGDGEGCTFENGVVRTPAGFKKAYQGFAAAGWTSLACDPRYGGQGLPKTVQFIFEEMICSTNLSFGTYPGLSHGAYNAISLHGSEKQKALYLPKLTDGSWSGTMCLTEPQCGTDLGLIKTKAEPDGEGAFHLTGTKIFISAGEHDLTRNIIHLVLARLPDAPAGTRGISLFIVPKYLVAENGDLGAHNGVSCGSIEHKMGIKASATCVMNFDGATGYLLGKPNQGMRCMFTMMNVARLAVGLQGLGLSETAYQSAAAYAKERLQGRSLSGAKNPERSADPILVHPDVRRNLMSLRAFNEGARALAIWIGMNVDIAERHADPETRRRADDLVALMTPVIKAYFTDQGFAGANLGLQVFGGHGYIREWGMEQLVRDARIAQIYEGANGIQALDLVGRKLGQHNGRLLRRFFHPVQAFIAENRGNPELTEFLAPLEKAVSRLQRASLWIAERGQSDPEEAGAASSDYLRLFALTTMAYLWARAAKVCLDLPSDDAFHRAKLKTARFFMTRLLPETSALFAAIMSGKDPVMALEAAAF